MVSHLQKRPLGAGTPGGLTIESHLKYTLDARQVKDAMRGRWLDYLAQTCPTLRPAIATVGTSQHHPAPGCHTSVNGDAFRFLDHAAETGKGYCNSCKVLDSFQLLELCRGLKFRESLKDMAAWLNRSHDYFMAPSESPALATYSNPQEPRAWASKAIQRLWDEGISLETPDAACARLYLENRGLSTILGHITSTSVLRFHEACPYWFKAPGEKKPILIGRYPAILAQVVDREGNTITIHRIYLTRDGQKAAPSYNGVLLASRKKMPAVRPGASRGASVRLFPAGQTLGLGEGLETCLAAHVLSGGELQVWAAVDAGGLEAVEVPDIVREVVILSDRDPNQRGQSAAGRLRKRMLAQGREARILIPSLLYGEKADFNDVLLKGVAHAV
jgi:putative DNA primase/helicase